MLTCFVLRFSSRVLSYVGAFPLALVVTDPAPQFAIAIGGGAIGGVAAGFLWTAQGAYFTTSARLYAEAHEDGSVTSKQATASFAALFGATFLGFELVLKLAPLLITIFTDGASDDDDARNASAPFPPPSLPPYPPGLAPPSPPSSPDSSSRYSPKVQPLPTSAGAGTGTGMVPETPRYRCWSGDYYGGGTAGHAAGATAPASLESAHEWWRIAHPPPLRTSCQVSDVVIAVVYSICSIVAAVGMGSIWDLERRQKAVSMNADASSTSEQPAAATAAPPPPPRPKLSLERLMSAVLLWCKAPTVLLLAPVQVRHRSGGASSAH